MPRAPERRAVRLVLASALVLQSRKAKDPRPTSVSGHEGGNSDEYNGCRQRQGVQPMRPDGVSDEPGEEPCDSDRPLRMAVFRSLAAAAMTASMAAFT